MNKGRKGEDKSERVCEESETCSLLLFKKKYTRKHYSSKKAPTVLKIEHKRDVGSPHRACSG